MKLEVMRDGYVNNTIYTVFGVRIFDWDRK